VTPLDGHGWQSRPGWAEGPSEASVARPNGYASETGDTACYGWGIAEAWHLSSALPLLGSMRGYRWKMRKGMPGWRSRGGREGLGWST
jgi:hypothetical protein